MQMHKLNSSQPDEESHQRSAGQENRIAVSRQQGRKNYRAVFDRLHGDSSFDFTANAATLRTNGLPTRTLNRNVFQVISQCKFASALRMILPPGEVSHDPEEEHNHRYGDQ